MMDYEYAKEVKHLAELMADADLYVKLSMKNLGEVIPTLFLHGSGGKSIFPLDGTCDERSKDIFATSAKLMCIAHGADATVFVSEAWMKFGRPGEPLNLAMPPSQCADRQETIIMLGETRNSCRQRLLPMLRNENGKFIGFGEEKKVEGDKQQGRFANFIPPKVPDDKARDLAKMALALRGIQVEQKGERRERGMERGT